MPRNLLALVAGFVFVTQTDAATQPRPNTAEATLAQAVADYERIDREAYPITAGREGDRAALRRLPDARPETLEARRVQLVAIGLRLSRIEARQLSADSALNHAVLSRIVSERVEEAQFDLPRIAFENDGGFHTLADNLARATNVATRDDAEAWLARLEALPAWYEQNIANLRRGVATDYTQPRLVVDRVLAVARTQAAMNPEQSPLLIPLRNLPATIPDEAQATYRAQALGLLRDRIQPVQRLFAAFLEREYLPAARSAIGWRSTPNGEASYRFLVRRETTT